MSQPNVSVVVPVYNDPNGLTKTVESLLSQQYDAFEIIIVDNNSTDDTYYVAETLRSTNPESIKLFRKADIQSSYAARNLGIEKSSGGIICFIDADMWVDDDWLESVAQTISTTDARYMGSSVELVMPSDPTFCDQYNYNTGFPVETYLGKFGWTPTCCLTVQANVFDEVGLFDERLVSGGDVEFGKRVAEAGIKQHYEPSIVMYHPTRSTFDALFKKSRRIGRGYAQKRQYHRDRTRSILHPKNMLPPHPKTFAHRLNNNGNIPLNKIILFYLFAYMLKLYKIVGRFDELKAKRNKINSG